MVYYKLILDTRKHKIDGLYPVVIRITFNKGNTTISTGVRIRVEHWDKVSQQVMKTHPNFQQLTQNISERYLKVQKTILTILQNGEFSFEQLKANLSEKPTRKPKEATFLEFSNQLIDEMLKLSQTGNALVYQTALNRFINYCNNKQISFKEVDYNLLNGFKQNLQLNGIKQNTISNYFRTLKAIYNKAIKAKIVDRSLYPFYDISIRQEKTGNRAITIDQIKGVVSQKLKINSSQWHARNYFMISFLLIGTLFTDLAYLKPENLIKVEIPVKLTT